MKKFVQYILVLIILFSFSTISLRDAEAKNSCGNYTNPYIGKEGDSTKLCQYKKDADFPCTCPENYRPICEIGYNESTGSNQEIIYCASEEEIHTKEDVIPYIFEIGIPFIVKRGESLQKLNFSELIRKLIVAVFSISGILAFIMIVWGGIEYMISGGDTKRQKSAQERITGAIIGLILLFAFWLILNTINPDILKVPSMNPPSNANNGGQNNNETSKIASDLLNQSNIKWYAGATNDLQDVKNGTPIDVSKNDPNWNMGNGNGSHNCEDEVIKNHGGFAKTINTNLLKAISGITSLNPWGQYCSSQYEVGPFISNHNYCISPTSSHKDGKAVDISLLGDKKDNKDCTRSLLIELCKHVSDIEEKVKNCNPSQFICTTTINGVAIGIINETCYDESHIHIQVIP